MKTTLNLIYTSKPFRLLTLLMCLSIVVFGSWQIGKTQTMKTQEQERIVKIFNDTLERSELNIEGVRVAVKILPSKQSVEELRQYGDVSIKVLSRYLKSESERERGLALTFLGLLGGEQIIVHLEGVIQHDSSPTLRIMALRWIAQVSENKVSIIIREAAEKDLDEKVREEAKRLLKQSELDNN